MSWPLNVDKSQLRIDYFRGSGAGGQNRNKRDTACRITHVPTGISVSAEEFRTQPENRKAAFSRLAEKLVPLMRAELDRSPAPGVSDHVIRTYNEKRNEVVDHDTGVRNTYKKTLNGDIEPFVIGRKGEERKDE